MSEYLEYERHTTTVEERPRYTSPSRYGGYSSGGLLGGCGGRYSSYDRLGGLEGTRYTSPSSLSHRYGSPSRYGQSLGQSHGQEWRSADGTTYQYDSPTRKEVRYQSPDGRRSVYESHEKRMDGEEYQYESREETGGGYGGYGSSRVGGYGGGSSHRYTSPYGERSSGVSAGYDRVTSSGYDRVVSPYRRSEYQLTSSPLVSGPAYRSSSYSHGSPVSRYSGGYSSEGLSSHGGSPLYGGGVDEEEYEEYTQTVTTTTW